MAEREFEDLAKEHAEELGEAQCAKEKAQAEAQRIYGEETYEKWKEYEMAWRPLREAWERFQRPFFEAMLRASTQAEEEYSKAVGKIIYREGSGR